MKKTLTSVLASLMLLIPSIAPRVANAVQPDSITICHATGSEQNPFVQIVTNENAIGGHFENNGTPKDGHEDDLLFEGEHDCPGTPPPPPEPTCETDPTLCPPEPTCETDPTLCPIPTCETDPTLCPPPPPEPECTENCTEADPPVEDERDDTVPQQTTPLQTLPETGAGILFNLLLATAGTGAVGLYRKKKNN